MASYEVYSQLPNEVFYALDGGKYRENGSLLHEFEYDGKIILILHTLYVKTDFARECVTTLEYLIEKCGYKVTNDSRKKFKDILNKLKEIGLINFKDEIVSGKMMEIDTEQLLLSSNFFQASNEEMEKFKTVEDLRLRTTLVKLYFYLKARVYKRGIDIDTGERHNTNVEREPQVTYQSYELIEKYTGISQARIKNYIDILQDMKLITYRKPGYRYKADDKNKIKTECPNVYAINNLQEDIDAELEFGVKRCIYNQREQGYVVTNQGYKEHDNKKIGLYGALMKKQKNNTITANELIKLNKLEKDINASKNK